VACGIPNQRLCPYHIKEVLLDSGFATYGVENEKGERRQNLSKLSKFNIFVGQNNSGKSRFLRSLASTKELTFIPNVRSGAESLDFKKVEELRQQFQREFEGLCKQYMVKRVQIALAVFLAVVIGVVGWTTFSFREPIYQGKSVSKWLEGYSFQPNPSIPLRERQEWQQADRAVRHLGTNAIPTLLRVLRATDAPWKLMLVRLAAKHDIIIPSISWAGEQNVCGAMAFASLRETASNSVPSLVQIYKENRSRESRNAVVIALGNIGPAAQRAVPCLLDAAANSDFSLRCNALNALGEIHAQPELVVPVLVAALRNSDESRTAAEAALGDFEEDAKAAVSSLLELLKDEQLQPQGHNKRDE
jgi:hypothetical protein